MSVELPFAPVDDIIRRNAADLRVSADAPKLLAEKIQAHGAERAVVAARHATDDGRKTLMAADFGREEVPRKSDLALPIAPIDRIARLNIDESYRVSMDARLVLAAQLETYADEVAAAAVTLTRHAGRRTVKTEDIETYFQIGAPE